MDALLLADRLPKLAENAMRAAIVASAALHARGDDRRITPRSLVDDALVRFERNAIRVASDGVRPALLFAERDRILTELGGFAGSRLAARLFRLRRRDVLALGRAAAPFDALVRGRSGGTYGVVFRRLARDGRRLETMRAIRAAARRHRDGALRGVLVYDFASSTVRTLRCGTRTVELAAA